MKGAVSALRLVGLVLVSLLAAASAIGAPLAEIMSGGDDLTAIAISQYAAWAIVVVIALSNLWRYALLDEATDGSAGRAQAGLALIIGFAAALGPLGNLFGYGSILRITITAGLVAPAGIWLASEARKRGARVPGMIAIILCSIGLVYLPMGFVAGALIPVPPPS
ncbi:MAG: hypothetical protein R6V07_17005 [Armatimonadota bacterium]